MMTLWGGFVKGIRLCTRDKPFNAYITLVCNYDVPLHTTGPPIVVRIHVLVHEIIKIIIIGTPNS